MTNLIMAGLRRYRYNPVWWVSVAVLPLLGAVSGDYFYRENTTDPSFCLLPLLTIAVFVSLTVAREQSGSAYRNKIVAGHTRAGIFFAELLLLLLASLLLFVLFFAGFVLASIPTVSKLPAEVGMGALLGFLMLTLASSSVFFAVAILSPRRTLGVVLCMLAVIGFMMLAENIHYDLLQKEYTRDIQVVQNPETGRPETHVGGYVPNPRYVGGAKRTALEVFEAVVPAGQATVYCEAVDGALRQEATPDDWEPILQKTRFYPLYSLGLGVLVSLAGFFLWKRRNIR